MKLRKQGAFWFAGKPFLLAKTVTSAIGFKSEKYISAMKYGVWPGYDAGGA
ncbi:hypothetical protein [Kosakonia cowanii]|uniref:hypothetical protein n=1 Tax=Kosakonia cowanii TaxID=208223 RepID=UPI002FDE7D71